MASNRTSNIIRAVYRILRPRSRGVPVSRQVLRHIRAAAAAQKVGDWVDAVQAYSAALAKAPHLAHVWVQYGHMLRETGRRDEAVEAYERAVALEPNLRESHLLLFNLARTAGDRGRSLLHALAAFRLDPGDPHAQLMLLQAVSSGEPGHAGAIDELSGLIGAPTRSLHAPATLAATLYVDVGDLVAHFARSRLPSGLQRVEIEVTRAILLAKNRHLALCCWSPAAATWKPLSGKTFEALTDAASSNVDDAGWHRQLLTVFHTLAITPAIAFPPGSTLFTLGMAWGDPLYHPAVTREKARSGLRFAAIACDVIPLVRPADVPSDIVAACGNWLDALADVADSIIAISSATRNDLVTVSTVRGRPVQADRIGVVRLDAVFAPVKVDGPDILDQNGLTRGSYALYVSTVEPRKNHLAAFETWRRLIAGNPSRVPNLVCVGRMGWRSETVAAALAADRSLTRYVRMLEGVSDGALEQLYNGCGFVFYPSLQEGWGLPVTEALAHGKVPVIGRNSSLPEAGGPFAVYIDASSPADMATTIRALIDDPTALAAREAKIRKEFLPREWGAVGEDMIAVATGKSA